MGKGEIARYEQFLLFPQYFQKACFPGASKGVVVWDWVNILVLNMLSHKNIYVWTRFDFDTIFDAYQYSVSLNICRFYAVLLILSINRKRKDKHKENEAIQFDFDLNNDNAENVAQEMVSMFDGCILV